VPGGGFAHGGCVERHISNKLESRTIFKP
jgi:hypothetical protein